MSDSEIRALQQAKEEVRRDEGLALDWDRLEGELLAKIEAGEEPRFPVATAPPEAGASRWWVAGALAAAAAVSLTLWLGASPGAGGPEPVAQAPVPVTKTTLDGADLTVGQKIHGTTGPIRVEHRGVASWTLAKGGEARLVERGGYLTVELVSGSVRAEVVPGKNAERFAVEVGGSRIAVRGTVFEVERVGREFSVQVQRGRVVVGPVGLPGSTRGWVLEAPSSGRFDSARQVLARSGSLTEEPSAPIASAGVEEAPVPPSLSGSTPHHPRTPDAAKVSLPDALTRLESATRTCFAKHTPPSDVVVSVQTKLTVSVGSDGNKLSYEPPLAPAVEACALGALGQLKLSGVGSLSRELSLGN